MTSKRSKTEKDDDEEVTCPAAWKHDFQEILFSPPVLQERVQSLAAEISHHYNGLKEDKVEIVCVGLLTGAICFMVDLCKHLDVPYTMDFMQLSSYRGSSSLGTVQLRKDLSFDPAEKHILIIEDIVDTGGTLKWLRAYLHSKHCKSIRVVCLLDKKEGRMAENSDVVVDYVGFVCPNRFVVGYGLDYNQLYRGLPFIGVLKPEVYGSGEE